MIQKYIVTGTPLFLLSDCICKAGEVIELPTQLADHPVAMGALRLAPPDAELPPAVQAEPTPVSSTVAPLAPLAPAKAVKVKKTK